MEIGINSRDVVRVKIIQYMIGATVDGVFGKNTTRILSEWQNKKGGFGKIGSISLSEWDTHFSDNIITPNYIKEARKYIGIKELDIDGDGSADNRGTEIDKMILECIPNFNVNDKKIKGFPWCACFLTYILKKIGTPIFNSARASSWLDFFAKNGVSIKNTKELKTDYLYIGGWVNPDGTGHVYFVDPISTIKELRDFNTVITVEGNTNDGGSREGDSVYVRRRVIGKNLIYGIQI